MEHSHVCLFSKTFFLSLTHPSPPSLLDGLNVDKLFPIFSKNDESLQVWKYPEE